MRIYDILPVGEENAIPGEEIERRLGITRRERRAMAAQELENGLFVLYTTTRPGGYFRPAEGEKGRQELARFYHREQARGLASLRKLAAVGAALAQCGDQTTLDSPKSARSIGQRLLTFADIREYLAQRNAQIITENTATLEEIYSFWTVTMRDQASKPADRLKASELLSKALIVERTRKENSDQSGAGHEFDGWSDEELRGAVHLMEDLSDEEFNAIMDAYNRKKRR